MRHEHYSYYIQPASATVAAGSATAFAAKVSTVVVWASADIHFAETAALAQKAADGTKKPVATCTKSSVAMMLDRWSKRSLTRTMKRNRRTLR
jgi:hypothetical protein